MNTEHINQWLAALRDPSLKQVTGTLAKAPDDARQEVGYCCLGVGCKVAGLDVLDLTETTSECIDEDDEVYLDYVKSEMDTPPRAFHEWLGIKAPAPDQADVMIDWPEGLTNRNGRRYREDLSCAALNDDAHLTFPQIADLIAYFGVFTSGPLLENVHIVGA